MRGGTDMRDVGGSEGVGASAKPRRFKIAFIAVVAILCLIPSVGMLWERGGSTTESELAPAPALFAEDGSFNVNVLSDAGNWFEDHFAYRNVLVDAYAHLRAAFGTSATSQVVVGDDGWLYYGGTLDDYTGRGALSDRALRNVAHNLALAQSYVEAQGASFAFTLAPNKNSVYPQHMPYYEVRSAGESNADRLKPLLEDAGVNYVDLFTLFDDAGDDAGVRYLKRDSHWDNRGALMAAQELLEALGRDRLDLSEAAAEPRDDFMGDLEGMLYPVTGTTEVNWYFADVNDGEGMSGALWSYAEGGAVTDSWSRTDSSGDGSLLMFRDSFGNALDPFLATSFGRAAFSKLVPYNLPQLVQVGADTVVIERAERHVGYLAENPPIMPAPQVTSLDGFPVRDGDGGRATISVAEDGPYWRIEGMLDDSASSEDSRIYVAVEPAGGEAVFYEASWKTVDAGDEGSSDFGYQAYVGREVLDSGVTIRVYTVADGALECLEAIGFEPASQGGTGSSGQ